MAAMWLFFEGFELCGFGGEQDVFGLFGVIHPANQGDGRCTTYLLEMGRDSYTGDVSSKCPSLDFHPSTDGHFNDSETNVTCSR
jgi:hypothetical protein